MKKEKRLRELISKYQQDLLSHSDLKELIEILEDDTFTFEKEKILKGIWNETENYNHSIDSGKIWNKIKDNINSNSAIKLTTTDQRLKEKYKWFSYAAVLVLAIGIFWYTFEYSGLFKTLSAYPRPVVSEYVVPYGSKSKIILSDSTKIWLNSGSKLRFDSDYNLNSRTVYLDGEAFFDVTSNKELPFYVKTNRINVKVYGTKFNVKAFHEDETIETTLISGSVVLEKTNENGDVIQHFKLKPNQIASYSQKLGKITLFSEAEPEHKQSTLQKKSPAIKSINPEISQDIKMAIAWKDNQLNFKGETFDNLILKLQRWYNVKITLKNEKLKDYRFTGTFDNETIEQALDALQHTTHFNFTIKENKIIIY